MTDGQYKQQSLTHNQTPICEECAYDSLTIWTGDFQVPSAFSLPETSV